MICCTFIAMLIGLLGWPVRRLYLPRNLPLAWRPHCAAVSVQSRFSLAARMRSFGFALAGVKDLLRTEHNAWLHLVAAMLVGGAGLALHVSLDDWRWLVLCIALVLAAEAFNTAIEVLCDVVHPERHEAIKRIKDIAAGAVLLCAAGAALIGIATLLPYLADRSMLPSGLCVGRIG
jgi:diacylglycerol kinase (ATP)